MLEEISNQRDALVIDCLLGPFGLFLCEDGTACEGSFAACECVGR